MKKIYFTLGFIAMSGMAAFSQGRGSWYAGIKGGLSVPNLKSGSTENDWNKDYESRQGPYFALVAQYRLSKYFYFQPELAYAAEGGRRDNIQPMSIPQQYLAQFQQAFHTSKDYLYANLRNVSRLNYLQLPLLIKFEHPIAFKGHLQAFVQAGPYLGYLLVSKQVVNSSDLHVYVNDDGTGEIPPTLVHQFFGSSIDTVIQAKDQLHSWNIGIQGGVGLAWISGNHKIFVEGGGNYGFVPVQKADEHGKNDIGAATILIGYLRTVHW